MNKKKLKLVEATIKSLTDSLLSHLPYIYSGKDKNFHKKCIKDYALDILNQSKLL